MAVKPRRVPNRPGDTSTCRGSVVRTYANADEKLLDIELHLDNQLGPDATIAHMTLQLP